MEDGGVSMRHFAQRSKSLERNFHLHVVFGDVTDVEGPPRQDLDGLDRLGRQQVSGGFLEEAEPAARPSLVHEVDVLVAADAEQAKTCKVLL